MLEAELDSITSASTKPSCEELENDLRKLQTELEQARKHIDNLRKSDVLLSQILQGMFIPTFVIDSRHVITHWNRAMEFLTGLGAADMIGTNKQWRVLYTSEHALMADLVVENAPEEEICRHYDGQCRKSKVIDSAYEVETFFPELGLWLVSTAAPLTDGNGEIIGAVETLQDITERKKAEEELRKSEQRYRKLSITDSLTKLHNSREFFRQLTYEVERAKRYRKPLSLALLDIDNFKGYNDAYGHPEGDRVLRVLADVIRNNLRSTDTAYRYGGEEFTILLPETEDENALVVAERVRKEFETTVLSPTAGSEVHMTISVGVSRYTPGELPAIFLKRVDETMYKAKTDGKNRSCMA